MHPGAMRRWLMAGAFAFVFPLSAASPSFDELLRQADEVRTSDPGRLNTLIGRLVLMSSGATQPQRERLAYLRAHQAVVAGDLESAVRGYESLRRESKDVDMQYRIDAALANSYATLRRFSEGLSALDRMLRLKDRVRDPDILHQGLLAAAILYNQVDQYALGQQYAEKALGEPLNDRNRCLAESLRLEALQKQGRNEADPAINAVVARCERVNERIIAGLTRVILARKHYDEGRQDAAIAELERHLPDVEATRYPRLIAIFHSLLGEYRFARGDIDAADRHARMAIARSSGAVYTVAAVAAYKTLYEIAEYRGDEAAALANYKRYAEADKAYLNDVRLREMAFQLVQQETLQKTQAIDLLNRQNQVLQLQQRVDKQATQNSRLVALMLLGLLASIGFWAYRTKRMQSSLRRMAQTDALTGICNRHHFTQLSQATLAHCQKAGEEASLIMFDLDHFKSINDRYGHATGDWVLRQVAEVCQRFCRRVDHFGRIGGEEFALLVCGLDLRAAARLAEDCRVRIAAIEALDTGHAFEVTASFGVSSTSASGYDLTRLMSHADEMLYRAKREGRNRVFVQGEGTRAASGPADEAAREAAPALTHPFANSA